MPSITFVCRSSSVFSFQPPHHDSYHPQSTISWNPFLSFADLDRAQRSLESGGTSFPCLHSRQLLTPPRIKLLAPYSQPPQPVSLRTPRIARLHVRRQRSSRHRRRPLRYQYFLRPQNRLHGIKYLQWAARIPAAALNSGSARTEENTWRLRSWRTARYVKRTRSS